MTLVLSANNIGSDTEFITRGRSFIYISYEQTEVVELIYGELCLGQHKLEIPYISRHQTCVWTYE